MSINTFEFSVSFWRRLAQPFYFLLFLYFFLISAELFHVHVLFFKFRINLLVGFVALLVFAIRFRVLRLDRDFLAVVIGCVGSMLISAIFSYFLTACLFFIALFVFNYFVFFVFPTNLFRVFDETEWILKLYFFSFVVVGLIATAQVVCSFFGIILPGVTQYIFTISRGQGFSYEPSYYALYMTPLAFFYTTKFFLMEKRLRSIKKVFFVNFLLLVSTSTGCFFSYLMWLFCMTLMKVAKIIQNVSVVKLFWKFFITFAVLFVFMWFLFPELIAHGFLKYFWQGFMAHQSFNVRWVRIEDYWQIFLDNFFIGTGLGGASTYFIIKKEDNLQILNNLELSDNGIAMNVTTEVLASLGIVGAVAFGGFFFTLWKNCRQTLRLPNLSDEERINVISFIVSMCVMFFALQFSQSIMRPYIWLHVGISVGYMKYLQYKYRRITCA